MSDGLRDDIINEFTRWDGWPENKWRATVHWMDIDAMASEIHALRQENTILREELDEARMALLRGDG